MKQYAIIFTPEAEADLLKLRKAGDKQSLKKIAKFIEELKVHPKTGTGHPEQMKYFDGIRWSRHISDKHRLVYDIFEDIVSIEVIQTWGHYDDK